MVGMETLRCPTCVTLLLDPDARRCPACHAKLRKRRSRPIVLGESNRLSGRSLPVDTELRTRSEERFEPFEPFVSKSKRKAGPVEAVIAFAPSEPVPGAPEPVMFAAPEPEAEPDIVLADLDESEIILDETAEEPEATPRPESEPEPEVPTPSLSIVDDLSDFTGPEPERESAPLAFAFNSHAGPIDGNNGGDDAAPRPVRAESRWQAVPMRDTSPFDGTLNDMVEELHRKAREDVGKHQ
jgi:hypothetical protein